MVARSIDDPGTITWLYKARDTPKVVVKRYLLPIEASKRARKGRMNVGFFTEVYHPVVNGVVASIDALAGGLRDLGNDVAIFAPTAPGYEHDAPPVFRIPSLPLPVASPYRLTLPHISRGARESVLDRLNVIHAHSPFVTGWMAARSARRLHVPLVYTYHTRLEEYAHYVPFELGTTKRAAEALTRTYANTADAVIVPTRAMRERLVELGVEVPIEVIPGGIDVAFFGGGRRTGALRERVGARDGERILLTVSRLAKEKQIELLLHALSKTRVPAHLAIAGEGPHAGALRDLAFSLGLADRVHFLGLIERAELPGLYASCDAFVFASVTETQGLVLAEALAAGALVIAPDTAQIREVVDRAGLLVPPGVDAFAAAFDRVPAQPDAERAKSAAEVAGRYGHVEQARRAQTVYEQLTRTYVRYTI